MLLVVQVVPFPPFSNSELQYDFYLLPFLWLYNVDLTVCPTTKMFPETLQTCLNAYLLVFTRGTFSTAVMFSMHHIFLATFRSFHPSSCYRSYSGGIVFCATSNIEIVVNCWEIFSFFVSVRIFTNFFIFCFDIFAVFPISFPELSSVLWLLSRRFLCPLESVQHLFRELQFLRPIIFYKMRHSLFPRVIQALLLAIWFYLLVECICWHYFFMHSFFFSFEFIIHFSSFLGLKCTWLTTWCSLHVENACFES